MHSIAPPALENQLWQRNVRDLAQGASRAELLEVVDQLLALTSNLRQQRDWFAMEAMEHMSERRRLEFSGAQVPQGLGAEAEALCEAMGVEMPAA